MHRDPNLDTFGFEINLEVRRVGTPQCIGTLEERPYRAPPLDHRAGQRAGTIEYEILAWGDVDALQWRPNHRRSGNFPTDQNLVAARDVAFIRRIHRHRRPDGASLPESLRPLLTLELTPEPGNPCLGGLHLFRVGGACGEARDSLTLTSVNGPGHSLHGRQARVRLRSSRYFTYTVRFGGRVLNSVIPILSAIARAGSFVSSIHAMTRSSFAVWNAHWSTSWQACFATPRCWTSDRTAHSTSKSLPSSACDFTSPANPSGRSPSLMPNRWWACPSPGSGSVPMNSHTSSWRCSDARNS